ncbi:MAG: hypothetical protein LBU12_05115 [Deltaproteobacteria bacterium]|nr:hypothetical protein [Deltaproteobacteria bacterium]
MTEKLKKSLLALALALAWAASPAAAQNLPPAANIQDPQTVEGREAIHLTTLGTYSAGFVLQSYGYIGILADVLSKDVYGPDVVRSMLGETITYLTNARARLDYYQGQNFTISKEDQKFIDSISEIIQNLIAEAEALSAFTRTRQSDDLKRFDAARLKAWGGIKNTLGVK